MELNYEIKKSGNGTSIVKLDSEVEIGGVLTDTLYIGTAINYMGGNVLKITLTASTKEVNDSISIVLFTKEFPTTNETLKKDVAEEITKIIKIFKGEDSRFIYTENEMKSIYEKVFIKDTTLKAAIEKVQLPDINSIPAPLAVNEVVGALLQEIATLENRVKTLDEEVQKLLGNDSEEVVEEVVEKQEEK